MIEAPETPHVHHDRHDRHEPRDDGHRWFDIGIALAVVLVSVGSLYVSLHTGETMEKLVEQNSRLVRANSVPLLQFDTGNVADDNVSPEVYMSVRNVGTGPARIVWFQVRTDGRPVRDVRDLMPKDTSVKGQRPYIVTSTIAPTMMPAGERRKIMFWPKPKEAGPLQSAWVHVDQQRQKLTAEACYCSLFDECWVTEAQADVPKPVARCETDKVSYSG